MWGKLMLSVMKEIRESLNLVYLAFFSIYKMDFGMRLLVEVFGHEMSYFLQAIHCNVLAGGLKPW